MHGYIEVTTTNRKSETSEAKKRKQCKEGAQMLCYQEKLTIPLGFKPNERRAWDLRTKQDYSSIGQFLPDILYLCFKLILLLSKIVIILI
jgi:hypothetical protein